MQALMILVLLFSLVVAVFAVQNAIFVPITFLTWHFETSLVYVILLATALGAVIVGLLGLFKNIKQGFAIKSLKSQNNTLLGELKKTEAELALAKELTAHGLRSKEPEQDLQLTALIKGTSPVVVGLATLVTLDLEDLDRARENLADCAGFYALVVSEHRAILLVDKDYWLTVETDYPHATVEPGWAILDFGVAIPKDSTDYLRSMLEVVDEVVSKCLVVPTDRTHLLAIPDSEASAALNKISIFAEFD